MFEFLPFADLSKKAHLIFLKGGSNDILYLESEQRVQRVQSSVAIKDQAKADTY